MTTNSIKSNGQLNEEPESYKLAIGQLLEQIEKRNQRLSLLRNENQQLTQQLAQGEDALQISLGQIKDLVQRLATIDHLESSLREQQEQIRTSDERIRELHQEIQELHRQIQELKALLEEKNKLSQTLSTQLAEKDGAIQMLSAEFAEQSRALQSRTEAAEERVAVISAQLLDTETQLEKIRATLGWRLLSRYGRFKYRFLLPLYRRFGRTSTD